MTDETSVGGNGRADPRWRYDPSEPLHTMCAVEAHMLCKSGWCGCPCHKPAGWTDPLSDRSPA
jgi:hypothetical protein